MSRETVAAILALAFLLFCAPSFACTVGTPSPYHGAYIVTCGKNAEFSYIADSQEHTLKVCQPGDGCEVSMNHLCYHFDPGGDFHCPNPNNCTYGGRHIEPTCWEDE